MDQNLMVWLKPLMWVVAMVLFILGGYSDTSGPELWGWGFALLTAGFLLKHLPGGMMGRGRE